MGFQKKKLSADNALMRLENLCSRSEHCEWELREKLRVWGIGENDAARILESLESARYYDDARFAAAFARDKLVYNRWGRRKIAMGLKAKRIRNDIVDDALESIDSEEYLAILEGFMRAKARTVKEGDTYEGRARLYKAALSRGFESQLISNMMRAGDLWPENDN